MYQLTSMTEQNRKYWQVWTYKQNGENRLATKSGPEFHPKGKREDSLEGHRPHGVEEAMISQQLTTEYTQDRRKWLTGYWKLQILYQM